MKKAIIVNNEFRESIEPLRHPSSTDMGLLEACSENPVLFVRKMLGVEPYAWQVKFLWDMKRMIDEEIDERDIVALTARQIGKSASLAWIALWSTVFNRRPAKDMGNTRVAIVSRSDDQARKLLREIRLWYRAGDRFIKNSYVDEDGNPLFGASFFSSLLSKEDPNNTTMISFRDYDEEEHGQFLLAGAKVGPWIGSFPPTAKVLGNTFTIGMIDEAGHRTMEDQFIIRELRPAGNANDAVWIATSTPWKSSGWFYQQCMREDDGIIQLTFTVDAIKEEPNGKLQYRTAQKEIEELRENGDLVSINIIYYCKFEQGEASYFNPQRVRDIFTDEYVMLEQYVGNCDMGVDFGGQVTSRTVITISAYDEDTGVIRRIFHRRYPVKGDMLLLEDIEELLTRFNVQRIIPDDCPAGHHLIRKMVEKGWNVQPDGKGMNFRSDKVKKYGAFRAMVNKGLVVSYEDVDLQEEMLALENSQTSTQSRIIAPAGYTDDLVDSFLMSAYFMIEEETGFNVVSWDDIDPYSVSPW